MNVPYVTFQYRLIWRFLLMCIYTYRLLFLHLVPCSSSCTSPWNLSNILILFLDLQSPPTPVAFIILSNLTYHCLYFIFNSMVYLRVQPMIGIEGLKHLEGDTSYVKKHQASYGYRSAIHTLFVRDFAASAMGSSSFNHMHNFLCNVHSAEWTGVLHRFSPLAERQRRSPQWIIGAHSQTRTTNLTIS